MQRGQKQEDNFFGQHDPACQAAALGNKKNPPEHNWWWETGEVSKGVAQRQICEDKMGSWLDKFTGKLHSWLKELRSRNNEKKENRV